MISDQALRLFRIARAGRRLWVKVPAFFATLLAGLFLVPLAPLMPASGIDPSWEYALNEAVAQHLIFGRDIIFTYGPFGSVETWLYHPATDALILAGSALIAAAFCLGFALLVWPRRTYLLLLLPIVVAETGSFGVLMGLPFLLLLVVFRLGSKRERPFRHPPTGFAVLAVAVLSCAVGILPLVKGNYSILAFLDGGLAVLMALTERRVLLAAGIASLSLISLCTGWVAAGQPLSQLLHFFVAQEPIVSGYTEAMSVHGRFSEVVFWVVAAVGITAFLYAFAVRGQGAKGWVLLAGFGFYAFLTFKEGFVRQDLHQLASANALLMTTLFLSAVLDPRPAIAVAVIGCLGWTAIHMSERSAEHFSADTVVARFESKVKQAVKGMILRANAPHSLPASFDRANAAIRAASPLLKVKGTVDLYPDNLSLLFAHKMRWDGRPIIQSYSAYTPTLEKKNAEHLLGNGAPENIFFAIEPIDNRLPALAEGPSWPLLLDKYRIVGISGTYLHMIRVAATAPGPFGQSIAQIALPLNEWVDVPSVRGPLWARIDMKPTLLGKLGVIAYKLPGVFIAMKLAGGRIVRFRYIPAMGRAGFVLSPYVGTTTDFLMMAAGFYGEHMVRQIKLETPNLGLWRTEITLSLRELRIPLQRNLRKLVLTEPASPPAFVAARTVAAVADCWIDAVDGQPVRSIKGRVAVREWVSLHGWTAPSARRGIGPDATWIALTAADGKRRFYKATATKRPDVLAYFKKPRMKDPGFSASLDMSGLSGNQELSVYSVHDKKAFLCPKHLRLAVH